jgi:hypothetical protein
MQAQLPYLGNARVFLHIASLAQVQFDFLNFFVFISDLSISNFQQGWLFYPTTVQ